MGSEFNPYKGVLATIKCHKRSLFHQNDRRKFLQNRNYESCPDNSQNFSAVSVDDQPEWMAEGHPRKVTSKA